MNFLYILYAITSCIKNNRSTYIIPSADVCSPNYSDKMDGYFFGPCTNDTAICDKILHKCQFAEYREHYCILRDSHFCGLRTSGDYKDYYQVECG